MDPLTQRNVERAAVLERRFAEERSRANQAVDRAVAFSGSLPFVWANAAAFAVWIVGGQLTGLDSRPYQALTLAVSLEAIFLAILVLISQNHQAAVGDHRARLDLQLNIAAEQESRKALEMLAGICWRLKVEHLDDELRALLCRVDLTALADEVESRAPDGPG